MEHRHNNYFTVYQHFKEQFIMSILISQTIQAIIDN